MSDETHVFAENSWRAEDLTERFGITKEEAEAFLSEHEKWINEAQCEAGWNYLLQYFDAGEDCEGDLYLDVSEGEESEE